MTTSTEVLAWLSPASLGPFLRQITSDRFRSRHNGVRGRAISPLPRHRVWIAAIFLTSAVLVLHTTHRLTDAFLFISYPFEVDDGEGVA